MNIIKLDAIESTNDYLKSADFNNIQVAYTYNQYKGKGQHGNKWVSEPGKNLAFSIKISNSSLFAPKSKIVFLIISSSFLV